MLRRTRATSALSGLALLSLLLAPYAQAQVDAQRFKPAVTHDGFVNAEGTAVRHPDDRWDLGLWLNYAHNPLVAADANGNLRGSFVGGRLGFDAVASASLTRRLALGASLPLYVLQSGDANPSGAGIGDLRLVPKLELLSDLKSGVGLALLAEVRLPTHSGDFSGGQRALELVPKVALDHRFLSGVRVGFNLGVAVRSTSRFLNVDADDELAYAVALGYRFGGLSGKTEIGIELDGGIGLHEHDSEELPLEALGYLSHDLSPEWQIIGGPGVGVVAGYGVPTLRGFLGIRFTPTSHDQDQDGVSDAEDECPREPEDRDGIEDADGCPEEYPDSDHDGVADVYDKCPDAKETINGVDDDDGCPDSGDPRVVYGDGNFTVLDTIRFRTGSAEIDRESHPLLDQIALTLKANPEIEHMRVEGHTDDTGPRAFNMQLSEERAHSVRRYLIQRGVNPLRLRVRSYGPDRPKDEGNDEKARARNRRVEFVLE
jgi:outer membrane protein OmpA-like peptidoglycan-associated protein